MGASYTSAAVNAAAQKTQNWIPAHIEVQDKVRTVLDPSPGLKVFATLPNESDVNGLYQFNGRMFAGGDHLWEALASGVIIDRGFIGAGQAPVSFAANQANQLLIAAGGKLYVFGLTTNVIVPVDMTQFPGLVDQVAFTDTYFVALVRNSNQFQLSALLDGLTWPGLNASKITVFPENIVSMMVAFREIWFQSDKHSTAYQDTGNADFPYSPIPSAYMEQGSGAQWAGVVMDNTGFWLGADDRGSRMAWRANGYTPQRISNHAVEHAWQSYSRIDDAIGYAYQEQGHSFWVLYFPTAQVTWVYDAATNMWHERAFWNPAVGRYQAHRSRCHCNAFGKHFVGDYAAGTIYEMSSNFNDDFGNTIRRVRRAPHISDELKRIVHQSIQIDLETGLGPQPGFAGVGATTTIILADSGGGLWQVQLNDDGIPVQTKVTSGIAQTVILSDATQSSSWMLGVNTDGIITTAGISSSGGFGAGGFGYGAFGVLGFGGGYNLSGYGVDGYGVGGYGVSGLASTGTGVRSYPMITISGSREYQLQVNAAGILFASPVGGVIVQRPPQLMLRWSDDSGHTWSNEYILDCGDSGEFKTRVIKRRLGMARDRVYEISCSDPIPWRIVDAYLQTKEAR